MSRFRIAHMFSSRESKAAIPSNVYRSSRVMPKNVGSLCRMSRCIIVLKYDTFCASVGARHPTTGANSTQEAGNMTQKQSLLNRVHFQLFPPKSLYATPTLLAPEETIMLLAFCDPTYPHPSDPSRVTVVSSVIITFFMSVFMYFLSHSNRNTLCRGVVFETEGSLPHL